MPVSVRCGGAPTGRDGPTLLLVRRILVLAGVTGLVQGLLVALVGHLLSGWAQDGYAYLPVGQDLPAEVFPGRAVWPWALVPPVVLASMSVGAAYWAARRGLRWDQPTAPRTRSQH